MSEMLIVRDLVKRFGDFTAINQVNLTIQEGVLTSIIGPNGAGKTTLINLITGYIPPSSGRIFFKGEDITNTPPYKLIKKGISRSFQTVNIFRNLTTYQNVQLSILSYKGDTLRLFSFPDSFQDVRDEAKHLLEEIGLWEKRNIPAGELSHGDHRLLELVLATALSPKLCFLDEPMSGLNIFERVKVQKHLEELREKKKITFVLVEHDLDVVFSISQRIIVMHQGKIIADGKPDEIKKNEEVKKVYLGEEL